MTKFSTLKILYEFALKNVTNVKDFSQIFRQVAKKYDDKISDLPEILEKTSEIKMTLDKYSFSKEKTNHVNLVDDKSYIVNKGKYFLREKLFTQPAILTRSLREATDKEITDSNILAIGGVDFDSPRYIAGLLKFYEKLAIKNSDYTPDPLSVVAVFPEVSRKERYAITTPFSEDNTYYSPYIEERVKKYLIPKFIDGDTLLNAKQSFSLVSFSIGGREIIMMERAFQKILAQDYGLDQKTITEFLSSCTAVCVGYAVSPSSLGKTGFNKVIVFSEDDHAVSIPKDLADLILLKESDIDEKGYLSHDLNDQTKFILIGHNAAPAKPDLGNLDHDLDSYLKAINSLPQEFQQLIGEFVTCTNAMDAIEC